MEDIAQRLNMPRADDEVTVPRASSISRRASKDELTGPTPLITAVEAGNLGAVEALIDAGARVDEWLQRREGPGPLGRQGGAESWQVRWVEGDDRDVDDVALTIASTTASEREGGTQHDDTTGGG